MTVVTVTNDCSDCLTNDCIDCAGGHSTQLYSLKSVVVVAAVVEAVVELV